MSIFERLKKRAAFPVADTGLFVRELTFGEVGQVQRVAEGMRTWLTLAFCLVGEDGARLFTMQEGESPEAAAQRMKAACDDHLTAGILNSINDAMTRLSRPANMEHLTKN